MAANDNVVFYQRLLGAGSLRRLPRIQDHRAVPGPIAWALFIGFLLQPAQANSTKSMRGRASAPAFTLTILVLVLFLGPLTAIAIAFARQATELAGRLQNWVGGQQAATLRELDQIPGSVACSNGWIRTSRSRRRRCSPG